MPSSEIPPKSKGFEEIVLWIVVGLFLALGVAWTAYPKIYVHYHPGLPWPVVPQSWRGYSGSSPPAGVFLLSLVDGSVRFLAAAVQPVVRPRQFQESVVALFIVQLCCGRRLLDVCPRKSVLDHLCPKRVL
jgi:hypothetical protein